MRTRTPGSKHDDAGPAEAGAHHARGGGGGATRPARASRAERKARTREDLVRAADRVFCNRGFHGASLDLVAAEAGYTKGAVYSNFASKEDLFFAVYERRVHRSAAEQRRLVAQEPAAWRTLIARRTLDRRRREGDDGWLAVFFEFWAHVLRTPDLRERFAALHAEGRRPLSEGTRRDWEEAGIHLGIDPDRFTTAMFAMVTGLSLEQLTEPALEAAGVAERMMELIIDAVEARRDGHGTKG